MNALQDFFRNVVVRGEVVRLDIVALVLLVRDEISRLNSVFDLTV